MHAWPSNQLDLRETLCRAWRHSLWSSLLSGPLQCQLWPRGFLELPTPCPQPGRQRGLKRTSTRGTVCRCGWAVAAGSQLRQFSVVWPPKTQHLTRILTGRMEIVLLYTVLSGPRMLPSDVCDFRMETVETQSHIPWEVAERITGVSREKRRPCRAIIQK